MVHELKTWPTFFHLVDNGVKKFEIRKNDRGFEAGHFLLLREWDPETNEYTGKTCRASIQYVLQGGQFGVEPGYVVMSIK